MTATVVFARSPEPSLTWSRSDGQPLPNGRYSVESFNSSLRIVDIQMSDEGDYKCEARNANGREHVIMRVDVQC